MESLAEEFAKAVYCIIFPYSLLTFVCVGRKTFYTSLGESIKAKREMVCHRSEPDIQEKHPNSAA
jgi:hypothetical protein